jgi:hypothetical protein
MLLYRYFEGWYFKQQAAHGTVALIPAMHADGQGNRSASIQIVTEDTTYCAYVPWESFYADRSRMRITLGKCRFCAEGIKLDIRNDDLTVQGSMTFGPLSPIRYDIMGPFRYVPFMECIHSVFSMAHSVDGSVTVNGKEYIFDKDLGYIEGDRGRSFPKRYSWTQYIWREESFCSLMLSVADIPFLGMHFSGVIGIVFLNGKEFRLATYLGAKVSHNGKGEVMVRQGEYTLLAKRLDGLSLQLRAPVLGSMTRLIREAPSSRVYYRFSKNENILLEKIADHAGFEYEYDTVFQ